MKFVKYAPAKLKKVNPTVVAITGSYGKTSTKGYVAQIVSGSHQVVASPASSASLRWRAEGGRAGGALGCGGLVCERVGKVTMCQQIA